ncbi:MAG: hypothetical protein JW955_18445 [Sedimentisphaerales bacterium]|nr:hypothetical protein [Sedimentisphaerales bacterium]
MRSAGLRLGMWCTLLVLLAHPAMGVGSFTIPEDGTLYIKPVGGVWSPYTDVIIDIEFGVVDADGRTNYRKLFTGLPDNPNPNEEVKVGKYIAGQKVDFRAYTTLVRGVSRPQMIVASTGYMYKDDGSIRTFTDKDNSLGLGGDIYENIGENTWIMHLDTPGWDDDLFDKDDDDDVLLQLRLASSGADTTCIGSYYVSHSFDFTASPKPTGSTAATFYCDYYLDAGAFELGLQDVKSRSGFQTLDKAGVIHDIERRGTKRPDVRFSTAGAEAEIEANVTHLENGRYAGEIRAWGTAQKERGKFGQFAYAHSEATTVINLRGPAAWLGGTWEPQIVSGSAAVTDPVSVVLLDQEGYPLWSETFFDVSIEQSGDLDWTNDGLSAASDSDLDFVMHLDMTSEYLTSRGAVDLEVHAGVVTASNATGIFADVGLPMVEEYIGRELRLPLFPNRFFLEFTLPSVGASELLLILGGGGQVPLDESLPIDDFEEYMNYSPYRVFQTWIDGLGFSPDDFFPVGSEGNGTGAIVGYDPSVGDIMETTIVHSGRQSMPFFFDNTQGATESVACRTFDPPQDWSPYDALSLWIHGDPNNIVTETDRFFVHVEDADGNRATFVHGEPNALLVPGWTLCVVTLDRLQAQGVDVNNIKKLGVGVQGADGPAGQGRILIDEIRLLDAASLVHLLFCLEITDLGNGKWQVKQEDGSVITLTDLDDGKVLIELSDGTDYLYDPAGEPKLVNVVVTDLGDGKLLIKLPDGTYYLYDPAGEPKLVKVEVTDLGDGKLLIKPPDGTYYFYHPAAWPKLLNVMMIDLGDKGLLIVLPGGPPFRGWLFAGGKLIAGNLICFGVLEGKTLSSSIVFEYEPDVIRLDRPIRPPGEDSERINLEPDGITFVDEYGKKTPEDDSQTPIRGAKVRFGNVIVTVKFEEKNGHVVGEITDVAVANESEMEGSD